MARYCSAQDNVRTRQSPPYRETIRVNVLHGRKSMSWAKSVLPLFTGASSETFRKVPDRVQIDTTLNRQNRVQNHPFIGRHRLLNRTAVRLYIQKMKQQKFGLSSAVALLILPLTPRICALCFDGNVHSVTNTGGWAVLNKISDVLAINEQQYLKCGSNIYFSKWDELPRIAAEF